MMQDAELAVTALAVQVKVAFLVLVEVHAPVDKCIDLLRGIGDNLLYRFGVAEPVAGNHRVVDMLLKVIDLKIGDTCHATLCEVGVGLIKGALAYERHLTGAGHFQSEAHSCHA